MLEAIIQFINARLAALFPDFTIHGLVELITREDSEGNKSTFPGKYCNSGELEYINLEDGVGAIYFRKNGDVRSEEMDEDESTTQTYSAWTYPFRAVLYAPKDYYKTDNAFAQGKIAENFKKSITSYANKTLRQTLKASNVFIDVRSWNDDSLKVAAQEVTGNDVSWKIDYKHTLIAFDGEIRIEGPESCFVYWGCGDETADIVFCPPGEIFNSDGTFLHEFASGGAFELPDINVNNSAGLLYTYPSVKDLTLADKAIKNSAGTTILPGVQGIENTLPDILVTNYDGTTTVKPAGVDVVSTQIPRVYAWPQTRGTTTEYQAGDPRWVFLNKFQNLPTGWIVPIADFNTLNGNNIFGNSNRRTGINGNQNFTDNYLIEHSSGLGVCIVLQPTNTWTNQIALYNTFSLTVNGNTYSDFWVARECDVDVLMSKVQNLGSTLNYAPFNIASQNIWLSDTNPGNSAQALRLSLGTGAKEPRVKTESNAVLMVRKHF